MSFLGAARAARSLRLRSLRYSTLPEGGVKKSSNLPFYLLGVGLAGIGAYIYMDKTTAQTKSPLDPKNFVDFKLLKVEPYNHNTSKFIFELPKGEASLLPVTSCVIVKSSDPEALKNAEGKPIIRPYTPISPSDEKGELTFLIKQYENGNASKHIHNLKPGETLSIKGPIQKFPYKINEFDEIGLISGGSGITPLYQLVTHALSDRTNKTKFKLVFANVTEPDILLREELDALKKKYPENFDVVYVLDTPEKDWKGPKGFVTSELIKEHIAPASLKDKVKIFVCGPPGQVAAVAGKKDGMKQGEIGGALKDLGYTDEQVYKF